MDKWRVYCIPPAARVTMGGIIPFLNNPIRSFHLHVDALLITPGFLTLQLTFVFFKGYCFTVFCPHTIFFLVLNFFPRA